VSTAQAGASTACAGSRPELTAASASARPPPTTRPRRRPRCAPATRRCLRWSRGWRTSGCVRSVPWAATCASPTHTPTRPRSWRRGVPRLPAPP